MSRHPEFGAGHPDNFDDRGDADFVCDGCLRTIYTGRLTRADGKLLCGRCQPDRLADLEALREVTEQLVVAADPYRRQYLAEKAETILRRLREPERVASSDRQCSCQWEEGGWPDSPHKADCTVWVRVAS